MKKIVLLVLCTAYMIGSAVAKNPRTILDNFIQKTGVQNLHWSSQGTLFDIEIGVDGMTMPMKIISSGDKYRADMEIGGEGAIIVGDSRVAYVTVAGQIEKITDPEQLGQLVPIKNLGASTFFDFSDSAVFVYEGQQGRGKSRVYVVGCTDNGAESKLYFNVGSGMLEKVYTVVEAEGEHGAVDVMVLFGDYMSFSGGMLVLPSVMTTQAMGHTVNIVIRDFQTNYPTTPWMFDFPNF